MKRDVPIGRFVEMANDKGEKETVKLLRVVSDQVEVWGKPNYQLEVERDGGKVSYAFHPRGVDFKVVCIYCNQPYDGPGAEHLRCALKHPHISLMGWFLWLAGFVFPAARKAKESLKDRIHKSGS